MDVTAINGSFDMLNQTKNIFQYPGNEVVHSKMSGLYVGKTDALSAVKLDPAVLEAQVTVSSSSENGQTLSHPEVKQNVQPQVSRKVNETRTQSYLEFKEMVMKQETALLSLTPQQMDLLMKFTDTLRRQRLASQKQLECSFCKNNGEAVRWYSCHSLKDSRGFVRCPVLRAFKCHLCGATGDRAHTVKYCPENILLDADYWSR